MHLYVIRKEKMEEYIFICIGTNRLIADSFGPRVGEKLKKKFKYFSKIEVLGTMEKPIHFNNAKETLKKLQPYHQKQMILIDSAIGKNEKIGNIYYNLGGIKIGKAFGKELYFPAHFNIKAIIGNKSYIPNWTIYEIDELAEIVANKISVAFLLK